MACQALSLHNPQDCVTPPREPVRRSVGQLLPDDDLRFYSPMSGVMRLLEEAESRGYYDTDRSVCSVCIEEPALQAVVRNQGIAEHCDYCGLTPKAPEATVDLELVVQLIVEGLRHEYEDPNESAGWNSQEGGWLVGTWDTEDLLSNHDIGGSTELINDILEAIILDTWCKYDPYADSPAEALKSGWSQFRDYVLHKRRYTFLARDDANTFGNELSMDEVPGAIVSAVEQSGLVVPFEAGTTWWRARVHQGPGESYSSAGELGTPPDQFARDNRMSPRGIGAFYGASTEAGAIAEVSGYASPSQDATVGCFTQLIDLAVVDLRDPPQVPSLFDAAHRHLREPIKFIPKFIDDVTAVAEPGQDQVLEYIPTQVVAEHLRYDLDADGIIWRSTKDADVISCVLFLPNATMTELISAPPGAKTSSTLGLDPGSVKFVPAPLA